MAPRREESGLRTGWQAAGATLRRAALGPVATVFRREIKALAVGLRCRACCALIVALMGISAAFYGAWYRSEVDEVAATLRAYETTLAQATVAQAAELPHPAIKPPWKLAFLVDGDQLLAPDLYRQGLSAWEEPELTRLDGASVHLGGLKAFDWMFLVQAILSFLSFVLAYDMINGERRQGTLKLALAQPVARWRVLAGKLLALFTLLALSFVVGACLGLGILVGYWGLALAGAELVKVMLVLALSLWAILWFLLLAAAVSALSRDPTGSLVVLALIWVIAVEAVPSASGLLAQGLMAVPTDQEVAGRLAEARQRIEAEAGGPGRWRRRDWAEGDGYAWERRSAEIQNRRFTLQEALRREHLERKLDQAALARGLSLVSPMALVQAVGEDLVGSGLARDRRFLGQAWAFRSRLADSLREQDGRDPASPHILFFTPYLSDQPLDPRALPRFAFQEASPAAGLGSALPGLLLLLLETLAVGALAFVGFARSDVG